jgi:hypothetical protein
MPPKNTLLLRHKLYCLRAALETFALPESAPGCLVTGASRPLPPLRTDAVNRGFCISLWMLAIIAFPAASECFLFFAILEI